MMPPTTLWADDWQTDESADCVRSATVETMLVELSSLPTDSVEFRRRRDRIVERLLPLADNVARRFDGRGEAYDDLVQVARIGLLKAVVRFDADRGASFVAFAVPTIVGHVRRHFRDNGWAVQVPRRHKDMRSLLIMARSDLCQRLHRFPTTTEFADELGIDYRDIVDGIAAANGYSALSIESGRREADGLPSILSMLGGVDSGLAEIEDWEVLRPALATLSDRDRRIIGWHFFESLSQSEIGARLGISQTHVSRLLARSLARLRATLLDEVGVTP